MQKTLLYRLVSYDDEEKNSRLYPPLAALWFFRVIDKYEESVWSLMKFWRR
jgi:hypothetical protein